MTGAQGRQWFLRTEWDSTTGYSTRRLQRYLAITAPLRTTCARIRPPAPTPAGRRPPRGADPYTLYDLVADFVARLDAHGFERCVLVGMSMGGYMAVRAALVVPQRLHGIVLIGASAVPFPAGDLAGWRSDADRWRYRLELGADQGRADAEQNFSRTTLQRDPQLVSLWARRIAQRSGPSSYREFLSWASQDDVRQLFAQHMKLPCLLIHGQEDAAVPLAHALETHRLLPAAKLLVLPYAGHAANLEYPETVNEALRSFCAECLRPGSYIR